MADIEQKEHYEDKIHESKKSTLFAASWLSIATKKKILKKSKLRAKGFIEAKNFIGAAKIIPKKRFYPSQSKSQPKTLLEKELHISYISSSMEFSKFSDPANNSDINDIRIMDFSFPFWKENDQSLKGIDKRPYHVFGRISLFKRIHSIVYYPKSNKYIYNFVEKYDTPFIVWKGISNINSYIPFLNILSNANGKQLSKAINDYLNSIEISFFEMSQHFMIEVVRQKKKTYIKKQNKETKKYIRSKAWFSTLTATDIDKGQGTLKNLTFSKKAITLVHFDVFIGNHEQGFEIFYCLKSDNWVDFYIKIINMEQKSRIINETVNQQQNESTQVSTPDLVLNKDEQSMTDSKRNALSGYFICFTESWIEQLAYFTRTFYVLIHINHLEYEL